MGKVRGRKKKDIFIVIPPPPLQLAIKTSEIASCIHKFFPNLGQFILKTIFHAMNKIDLPTFVKLSQTYGFVPGGEY